MERSDKRYGTYVRILESELVPAMGCTEPIAVAFCAAKARVLKDAPILILDEATAFADPDNETKVQAAFEELSKGKTLIMIAHRLSTVMNADRIFVMDDGRCVEAGSHEELMKRNGLYKRMFDEYTRSIEWKVGA